MVHGTTWHLDIAICLTVIVMKKCYTIAFGDRFQQNDDYRYIENTHYRYLAIALTIVLEAIVYRTTFIFVRIIFTYIMIVAIFHFIRAIAAITKAPTAIMFALPAPQVRENLVIAAPQPLVSKHHLLRD